MKAMSDELNQIMDSRKLTARYQAMVKQAVADPEVQTFLKQHKQDLDADAVERGAAKIYEYVSQRDKHQRGQEPFAPGYAPKLIASNRLIDITYVPTAAKVAADAEAAQKALVTAVNMPKAIANASLQNYLDEPGRQNALNAAMDFTMALVKQPGKFHKGLYLTGAFGVGKTYLLGAIANDLAKQKIASTLVHVPTFAVEMKAAISDKTVLPKVNAIKDAQVLMLDDIGAEALSPWIRDEVLGVILQYRMQEELPTLFSSNKTMDELGRYFAGEDRGDNEMLKAQRIMERVRYLADEITVSGENLRQAKTDVQPQ